MKRIRIQYRDGTYKKRKNCFYIPDKVVGSWGVFGM